MNWIELSVEIPSELVETLSQMFYRYGHGGVAVIEKVCFNPDEGEHPPPSRQVTLKTYLPLDSTSNERRNRIDLGVRLVAHAYPATTLQEKIISEEDWESSWKKHFDVLSIGNKIVICPTWRNYEAKKSDVVIMLDPGMAFGTGHHPTTRICLEELEHLIKPDMDVLDVGCGSGILSIAAAKLGARSVFGLEIDSVAVQAAKQNVQANKTGYTVRIAQGSLPSTYIQPHSYNIAVANISSKIISEIASEIIKVVKPGGKLIASGILIENMKSPEKMLSSAGLTIEKTLIEDDWVTLVASIP